VVNVKRSVKTVSQVVGQNGRSGGRSKRSVKRSVRALDRPISVMVMTGHDRSWPWPLPSLISTPNNWWRTWVLVKKCLLRTISLQ